MAEKFAIPNTPKELWDHLQAPFGPDDIELLPRATGKKENRRKEKCAECGGFHEFPCVHLSYVGHAGITMRLNDVDPTWTWEPMAYDERGLPALDAAGGLWAWLTILGVRKPAYGDPGVNFQGGSKSGTPDGMKEAIGDMLRNGAMRFGVGTQLWSKSDRAKNDLMKAGEDEGSDTDTAPPKATPKAPAASGGSSSAMASEKQAALIHVLAKKAGYDDAALKGMLKVRFKTEHASELRKGDASKVIEGLQEAIDKAAAEKDAGKKLEGELAAAGFSPEDEEVPF